MTDFFISYTQEDCDWAEWISWILEEAGYSIFIKLWDFRPGNNYILEVQRTLQKTSNIIIILSESYLNATDTCAAEWSAFFCNDPKGLTRTLIPICVQRCQRKGLLNNIICIDLVGLHKEEAQAAILGGLEGRAKPNKEPSFPFQKSIQKKIIPSSITFPGPSLPKPQFLSKSPPHNIPDTLIAQEYFKGRDKEISILHQLLELNSKVYITGKPGFGKTELAIQYCHKYLGNYPGGIFWLLADKPDLATKPIEFARIHWGFTSLEGLTAKGQITKCWKEWNNNKTLIVIDNVVDYQNINPFLPELPDTRFKLLIISRYTVVTARDKVLKLSGLQAATAIDLFTSLVDEDFDNDMFNHCQNFFSTITDYSPILVHQLAAFANSMKGGG